MRRYLFIVFFVVVLALPFALRSMLTSAARAPALGPDMPAARLVIVTPNNQDIRREFARAFDAWHRATYHQAVTIDYRTPGGTNDIRRLLETTYRNYLQPDGTFRADMPADLHMVWGGGDYTFDREYKRLFERNGRPVSVLQPAHLTPGLLEQAFPQPTLAGVKLYDDAKDASGHVLRPQWIGTCLSSFGIIYNPDLYRLIGLPTPHTWADLTDQKLAGKVALADPTHSGSVAVAYLMVLQRAMADAEEQYLASIATTRASSQPNAEAYRNDPAYGAAIAAGWKRGMGQLLLIAANARYFTDSASTVVRDVGDTGDAAVGVAIDFYARVEQESVGPSRARFVSPAAATAITPDPIAILAGVKGQPFEIANHFIEFVLSPQGQRLWILKAGTPGGPRDRALRRPPIRRDVYDDRTNWADDVDPFTDAGSFNQRPQWMGLFTEIRPLWAAAWIDSREALRDAYARILAVRDPQRRSALIARLADLPIEMSDVQQLAADRLVHEKRGDAEEWKARSRIDWANRFRAHYARVAAEAGE